MKHALAASRSAFFLMALTRRVGELQTLTLSDGQAWENSYRVGDLAVALSDTFRNLATDKKGKSQTPGFLVVEYLDVAPAMRGRGLASEELRKLCQLADKWTITLRLRPLPYEPAGGLQDEALTAWYTKAGFTLASGLYLERPPRR